MSDVRRLVVNADDFGRSASINAAVIHAHREGILTSASLMVNEPAGAEAVALAKENPGLGVGLHLVTACGRCGLPPAKIPGLVNQRGEFSNRNPILAGMKYFLRRDLGRQLRDEIHEQFRRFRATGLPLDHVNGHLHLHLHPVIFRILMEDAAELGVTHLRLTCDSFRQSLRLSRGRVLYRATHAFALGCLARMSRAELIRRRIRHTPRVYGLLQDSQVDEQYVLGLLARLPAGDSELYCHPSYDAFRHELDGLVSPKVKARVAELGIKLIRYQDL